MTRTLSLLCALTLALSLAPQASAVSYEDAQPIFAAKCGPCHTTGSSGAHAIGANYADGQQDSYHCDGLSKAACCLERIEDGSMPPSAGCNGPVADGAGNADVCVTESEFDVLEAWIAEGQLEATSAAPEPDPECSSDGDCVGVEVCEAGLCRDGHGDAQCQNDEDCGEGESCSGEICVGTNMPNPCDACTADQSCVSGDCVDGDPPNGDTGVGDGYTYDEDDGCQSGGSSPGGLMLLLAVLSLLATRPRRARASLR